MSKQNFEHWEVIESARELLLDASDMLYSKEEEKPTMVQLEIVNIILLKVIKTFNILSYRIESELRLPKTKNGDVIITKHH